MDLASCLSLSQNKQGKSFPYGRDAQDMMRDEVFWEINKKKPQIEGESNKAMCFCCQKKNNNLVLS